MRLDAAAKRMFNQRSKSTSTITINTNFLYVNIYNKSTCNYVHASTTVSRTNELTKIYEGSTWVFERGLNKKLAVTFPSLK